MITSDPSIQRMPGGDLEANAAEMRAMFEKAVRQANGESE